MTPESELICLEGKSTPGPGRGKESRYMSVGHNIYHLDSSLFSRASMEPVCPGLSTVPMELESLKTLPD